MINSLSTTQKLDYEDPAIGAANLDQKTVNVAIQDIFKLIALPYLSLSNEAIKNLKSSQMYYDSKENFFWIQIPRGFIRFIDDEYRKTRPEDCRYNLKSIYKINELTADSFPGNFLLPLHSSLEGLKYSCNSVSIRFEKGLMDSGVPEWHLDIYKESVTICYSNVKDWSTRVIDKNSTNFFCGKSGSLPTKRLDEVSNPSLHGYFYDAKRTLHRSPNKTDTGEISSTSYRLFIRFVQD